MASPGHRAGDPPRSQAPAFGYFSGVTPFPGTVTFDTGVAASYAYIGFPAGSFWPNFRDTGLNVTINSTSPTVTLFVTTGAGFGGGTGNRFLRGQRVGGSGAITSLCFASNSGTPFNLQSIALQAGMVPNTDQVVLTIKGYLSGALVTSYATGVLNDATWPTSAISTPGFTAIDSFAVTAVDQNTGVIASIGVDAINIGTPPVLVSNPALSNGTAGVTYTTENFSASGGTSPYSFAKISGSLPPGMSLSTTGALSGKPTAVGTFNFTVQATDATLKTSVADPVSLTVGPPNLAMTPTTLSDATYGSTYTAVSFAATGGNAPYTYSYTGLPPGMTINSSNGQLTGKPTAAGTFSVSVTATDATTGTGSPYQVTNFITLVVDKVPLTITPVNALKFYGAALPIFTANMSGFVNGDNSGSLTTQPTFNTGGATASSPVGTYTLTAGGAVDPNYSISYGTGATLTINPVSLTITPNDASMNYGAAVPAFTASYSGLVNGDVPASLNTQPNITTTATSTSLPNTYPITASGAVDPNYIISYGTGVLTVNKGALVITASDASMTYGGAVPTLGVTYSGFVGTDGPGVLTSTPTVSTTATSASGVGTYPITASGAAAANYDISYVAGTMTVGKATLNITGNPQSVTYGLAGGTESIATGFVTNTTVTGYVNGDNAASAFTALPTLSSSVTNTTPVGTYPITISGGSSDNYTFNITPGVATVTPATATVVINSTSVAYGMPIPVFTFSLSGLQNGEGAGVLTTQPVLSTTAVQGSPVGTYTITGSGAAANNYTFNYTSGTLTVTAGALTITASDASMTYGGAVPTLGLTYSGFAPGDNPSNAFTTPPAESTTATSASAAGTYPITVSGAVSPNYNITYVDGTMTVGKAVLTVTGTSPGKTYGAPVPALGVTYSGFVNGDNATALSTAPTSTTTATASSPVGTYPVTPGGGAANNYTFNYVPGTLTVTAAQLDITASDETMVYGGAFPTFGVTYSGFVNGDNAASLTTQPAIGIGATPSSPVGTYPLTPQGAVDPNYTFVYHNGTLTITAAALTITAGDATMPYGGPIPALTATYSGFVNGDNVSSLTTLPTLGTTATTTSPVGTYATNASGAVDPNYTITYVDGVMTVTKAVLTVTADDKTMPLGGPLPALTVSYSGFIGSDNASSLTTRPTASTSATAGSPAGSYTITPSGGSAANYTFAYVNGTLTVQKAILTITANDAASVYGSPLVPNGSLTISYSGFVHGDNSSGLTVPPTVTNTAFAGAPVGSYALIPSGAVDPNYTIVYVNGTYSITPAPLTVTASDASKAYGAAMPALAATYSGFVNGDNTSSLTIGPVLVTPAIASSPVGTYPITPSGAVDPNYTITYVDGTLTIGAAPLTITAGSASMAYGGTVPALSASYSGFVNGDNASSLATAPSVSTTATSASPVGTYPTTASGAVDPNYTITYVPGVLTVGQAALTITATDASMTYGGAVPALGVTYSGFINGDNAASLTTQPTVATTGASSSPAGVYPITASGAVDPNYTITYTPGTLTIGNATLTVTAANASMTYGGAVPSIGFAVTGFVNGDGPASFTTPPTTSTTATSSSPAGSYPTTAAGAVINNYTLVYAPGVLTVGPAALTITASNASMTYGGALPALGVTYSGFVNGDNAASLSPAPAVTTTATSASPVGTYPTTAAGASDPNYTISYVPGVLTVGPATLTVTAADASRYEGLPNPAFSVSYSGFVNGDNAASLTTLPSVATAATVASPAGTYPIVPSGAAATNYTFTYVDGTLTVIALMPNVITFNSLPAKTYGDADFAISATASSGLPVTLASLDNTVATVYQSGSGQWMVHIVSAGQVLIAATQAGGPPYAAATEVDQNLVIDRASQVIVFPNPAQFTPTTGTTLTLNAVASSGLPITYATSDPTIATVSGNQLTITGTGSVVVTASQPGSMNYLPAAPVSDTLQPYDQRGFHDGVGVFPNPAHGTLYIHLSAGYIVTKVTMFDLHGRVVAGEFDVTNNSSTIPVDISHLLPGIYILNVVCERDHQIAYPFFKILVE